MTYSAVHMKTARLECRLTQELIARVDAEADRLGQTRTKYVERALESALSSGSGARAEVSSVSAPPPSGSASSRASAKKTEIALEARDAVQKRNREKPPAPSGDLPKIAPRHWA